MSALEPGLVRRALDELLRLHPQLDLVRVDWQVDPADGRSVAHWAGPWVLVDLGQPSEAIAIEPAWAVWRFAIWRATGALHAIGVDGAVVDPPLWEPS